MRGINKIDIHGYVGKAPEITEYKDGTLRAKFTLATNNANSDEIDWHDVIAKNKVAEVVKNSVKEGDYVAVSGMLKSKKAYLDGLIELMQRVLTNINAEQPSYDSLKETVRKIVGKETYGRYIYVHAFNVLALEKQIVIVTRDNNETTG